MEQLLVKRALTSLVKEEGVVQEIKPLPDFLKEHPLIVQPTIHIPNNIFSWGDLRKNMFLKSTEDDMELLKKLHEMVSATSPPAWWSGYRSCLTLDEKTGQLYRLKGVAFKDKKEVHVDEDSLWVKGAQFLMNAKYEKIFSNKFNKVLKDNGMDPVMEYVGLYKYPGKVRGRKLATSIIKIISDTRLDEFFYSIECLYQEIEKYKLGPKFVSIAMNLYFDIGYIVGSLKKLMDRSEQTWSDNPQRSNANIGNVVIYRADRNNLALGFVDYDASCDLSEMSRQELIRQQESEYRNLVNSAALSQIGFRPLVNRSGGIIKKRLGLKKWRHAFGHGYIRGYRYSRTHNTVSIEGYDMLSSIINEVAMRSMEDRPDNLNYSEEDYSSEIMLQHGEYLEKKESGKNADSEASKLIERMKIGCLEKSGKKDLKLAPFYLAYVRARWKP